MKSKHLLFLLSIGMASSTLAQQSQLSLQDAVTMALANRNELKMQKLNTAVSQKQLSEVQTRSLPQVSSDLDFRYNTSLQTNILPGNVFGTPNSPDKEVKFGTPYNTQWAFNLNQSLYNPANISDRRIAAVQAEYQRQNENLTAITIREEVTEAYFSALLWKEKVKQSQENVKRAQEVYQVTQDQLGMGQATTYDVQKNWIDLENAKATDEQNGRSYLLSLNDLLYKIGSDNVQIPVLRDSIIDLLEHYSVVPSDSGEIKRVELRQEQIQLDIYNENIKKQKLSYVPTVSAYADYSLQYMSNKFDPFTSKYWYPFNYVGVKISIPIFDGGLKAKTKQEYQLRADASRHQYEKLKNDYRQEILSAGTTLNNSISDLNYQKKNLELIEELYRIDKGRLKNGTIRQSDLTTTLYTLLQTQTNYVNAIYNYLVAVVKYKKSMGSL